MLLAWLHIRNTKVEQNFMGREPAEHTVAKLENTTLYDASRLIKLWS